VVGYVVVGYMVVGHAVIDHAVIEFSTNTAAPRSDGPGRCRIP